MPKLTINDISLQGKRVLVRVDFNVPLDEHKNITDDTRIVESLPTIKKILDDGGKAILMSHLGRPKGKPNPEFSLQPVAKKLSQLLNLPVQFAHDCIGKEVETVVANLKNGECLLLENLRFHKEEEESTPEFAKALAKLGDVFVNDAFGTAHRAHTSTEGITKHLTPSVAGYLLQKELQYLGTAVENPKRPFIAILGGAKISGKIDVIHNLLSKVDTLLIGGGMAYTFFKAQGLEIGKSLLEADKVDLAKNLLQEAEQKKVKILLPIDCVVVDNFDNNAQRKIVEKNAIPKEWQSLDIGPKTIALFSKEITNAKTVVWNGPMGVFELPNFAIGTTAIAQALVEATSLGATTIVGGGDSAAAITQIGLEKKVSHVSTGGGASLEFLEGKVLPGVAALSDKV